MFGGMRGGVRQLMVRCTSSLLALSAAGCGADGRTFSAVTGQVHEGIQAAFTYVQGQTQGLFQNAEILTTGSSDLYGVMRVAAGNCGVTFISKHYAITASHCMEGLSGYYPNVSFEVDQVLTTSLNASVLPSSEALNGNFGVTTTAPNWVSQHKLTIADGYNETKMQCGLFYRCDGSSPAPNCTSAPASGASGKDIALIYCPTRAATSYVTVNTGDPASGSVLVNWFHEVLNTPTSDSDPYHLMGNWPNYGCKDAQTTGCMNSNVDNFHYTNILTPNTYSQFLPLQSVTWPGGTKYSIVANGKLTDYTWTDVPGCHGTSGSGFFLNGTSTLLGPALSPGPKIATGRLCTDMFSVQIGGTNLSYGAVTYTRALEAVNVVQLDR